jgi:D-alanine-D-alanine ligase
MEAEPAKTVEPLLGADELKRLRNQTADAAGKLATLRVAVVCGGDTAEREVSLTSGCGVRDALLSEGISAELVDLDYATLDRETLAGYDLAFLTLHGGRGEDGSLQGYFDSIGVRYVGAGVLASAVGMHKPTFKTFARGLGLSVPPAVVVHRNEDVAARLEPLRDSARLVVKPANEGSSVGVKIVAYDDAPAAIAESLQTYPLLLVEERIAGREVTASVLGRHRQPVVLPHVEIAPVSRDFYDYRAKYTKGETDYVIPARLTDEVARQLARDAALLQDALELAPYARIDTIVDNAGTPHFLEANTLPGFTSLSLVPQAAAAAGVSYGELLRILAYLALEE